MKCRESSLSLYCALYFIKPHFKVLLPFSVVCFHVAYHVHTVVGVVFVYTP